VEIIIIKTTQNTNGIAGSHFLNIYYDMNTFI